MTDIYNDRSYISNNPGLHREDSVFKFDQIVSLLRKVQIHANKIKILDIGGGAGELGFMVANYFKCQGIDVNFYALDLSEEMLAIQSKKNPYIVNTWNCSVVDCPDEQFDLALMIDVIEHIPGKDIVAERLNRLCKNIIYNIPIQINLFDLLRELANHRRYYSEQTRLIGHVHFFTYVSARRFIDRYYRRVSSFFKPYCFMMLASCDPQYVELRRSRVRLAEVKLSCWIAKHLAWLAPWVVQGSMFALVNTNLSNTQKR